MARGTLEDARGHSRTH